MHPSTHPKEVPLVLKKSRSARSATSTLTFVLPSATLEGTVSVVGTFNDWTPGAHPLRRRSNGTVSASVVVPTGSTVRFRYLGSQGRWFDDADADEITPEGSVVRA